jgi:hypothetical protein
MAKKAKASTRRDAPLSKADVLIAEIVATLEVDSERRDECLAEIHFRLRGARSLQRLYAKMPPAGQQKRKASALCRALKKARSLSQEIEPLFSAMFDELINYDVFRRYVHYRRLLDHAIAVADQLRETVIVPHGQKQRDASKFLAKTLATDLVDEFWPHAGHREIINRVASLTYEIFTGREGVDISEPPDAYMPPTIRTNFVSRLTPKKSSRWRVTR